MSKESSSASPDLWPVNVKSLHEIKIKYEWRCGSRDLVVRCTCGGKLILDEAEPFHTCLGDLHCAVGSMPFPSMMRKLAESKSEGPPNLPTGRVIQLSTVGHLGITSRVRPRVRRKPPAFGNDCRYGIEFGGKVLDRVLEGFDIAARVIVGLIVSQIWMPRKAWGTT